MRGAFLRLAIALAAAGAAFASMPAAQSGDGLLTADALKTFEFRSLGPSLTTGRISDIAVDPRNPSVWYVAAASGNLWKTENRGNTWTPVFDDYGSYSLGAVTVDPRDSRVVWLGTGENNNQRSVGFGDGVYRSADAGRTWRRMGLEHSGHIQNIVVDPRSSDVIYVTAIGPLWSPGGERGVYKSTDGGRSWKAVLTAGPDTGATDLVMDPQDPEVLYAATYQRRRAVGQLIGGGPGSGIWKTADGGRSWTRLTSGLPTVDMGRIGLAIDWRRPRTVYAIVAAQLGQGGFFRSDDAGASWERIGRVASAGGTAAARPCPGVDPNPTRPSPDAPPQAPRREAEDDCYRGGDPGYYHEIVVDPHDPGTIWSLQTYVDRSTDGGRTWQQLPLPGVHVDNHDIVLDPHDRNHILLGTDGGLYETWDGMKTWRHFTNLPLSQFYRIALDEAAPFYNVCGGMQDNGTICGPSRTVNRVGIRTSDWYSVGAGDGFQPRFATDDPATVYLQSQEGALSRLDRRTGRTAAIRPRLENTVLDGRPERQSPGPEDPRPGAPPRGRLGRWHWDAPLVVSPHGARRLYYAGERVYRSDDRGESWSAISPDLTRNLDRTQLEIMGRIWPTYAVAYNQATTTLSTITALEESPLLEGLIYAGTDDGLVQVTEDGGRSWLAIARFPGVAEYAYVTDVFASRREADTVFVTFNNYQRGDYRPYVIRSGDRGRTWTSLAGDLPVRSGAWSIVQDHVNGDLLFVGLEFGVWVSLDGGRRWIELAGGLPTIQARDLHVQRREHDLVVGTFGRGVYILDDYSALREIAPAAQAGRPRLLPLRDAYVYEELALEQAAWGNVATPNPPAGATFTILAGEPPGGGGRLALRVSDERGRPVRRIEMPWIAGVHRAFWDLRVEPGKDGRRAAGAGAGGRRGRDGAPPLAMPGLYRVTLHALEEERLRPLGQSREFRLVPLPR